MPADPIIDAAREVMSGESPLTTGRRERFEEMGEETVIAAMGNDPSRIIGGHRVQAAAREWLKEKREARNAQEASDRKLTRASQKTGIIASITQTLFIVGSVLGLVIGGSAVAFFLWLFGLLTIG